MSRFNALAAIAVACLSSVTPAFAQQRTPVTVRVSSAGLDMSKPESMARLRTRLRTSVRAACDTDSRDLMIIADSTRCVAEMQRDGDAQLAALSRAGVRTASNTDTVIALAH